MVALTALTERWQVGQFQKESNRIMQTIDLSRQFNIMHLIAFPEANRQQPNGAHDTENGLCTLHYHTTPTGQIITCWQLTEKDIELAKGSGHLWLIVQGPQIPVITMTTHESHIVAQMTGSASGFEGLEDAEFSFDPDERED